MNFLIQSFLFCFLIESILTATFSGDFSDPKHPGKCNFNGNILEPGQHNNLDPERCFEIQCHDNGFANIETCGTLRAPPGCKFVETDKLKPYPDCCMKNFVCRPREINDNAID